MISLCASVYESTKCSRIFSTATCHRFESIFIFSFCIIVDIRLARVKAKGANSGIAADAIFSKQEACNAV